MFDPNLPEREPVTYQQEIEAWRARRISRLTSEDGWTTLVGLHWLETGDNSVGAAVGNRIVLDCCGAPSHIGVFALRDGQVRFDVAHGTSVTHNGQVVDSLPLEADDDNGAQPTLLQLGTLRFYVIRRGEQFGIRVKDSAADTRINFKGLDYFPVDSDWRLPARFEAYAPPSSIPIVNILGMHETMISPGAVVFTIAGREYRLDAVLEAGETDYFVMFADRTNGNETYGAGRFLYVAPPINGATVIDFNKAYTPPCAFSTFATCPLPPEQNRLPIAITAGELKYAGSDH